MNHQDIVTEIIKVLTPLVKDKGVEQITEDTELTGELALDSMQVMNMLLELEDAFDISIPVNAMADIKTVGDLANQIEQLMSGHS
ncbi:acyl carrier protein [Carnimonas nigrificans]|uniref:acyl carrier protein n=1 Tax=Carnimonas nigrificans TaxID=64323 RepID=UPI0004722CBD|nr:acyl carrier protein [Carnimonas nigrificans]